MTYQRPGTPFPPQLLRSIPRLTNPFHHTVDKESNSATLIVPFPPESSVVADCISAITVAGGAIPHRHRSLTQSAPSNHALSAIRIRVSATSGTGLTHIKRHARNFDLALYPRTPPTPVRHGSLTRGACAPQTGGRFDQRRVERSSVGTGLAHPRVAPTPEDVQAGPKTVSVTRGPGSISAGGNHSVHRNAIHPHGVRPPHRRPLHILCAFCNQNQRPVTYLF